MINQVNAIYQLISEEQFSVVFLLAIFIILLPVYKRLEKIDFSKYTTLSKFKEIQQHEYKDKILSDYIDGELESLLFYKATKIKTNIDKRLSIINCYNELRGDVSMVHFKRAYYYLVFKDEHLQVNIGTFSKMFFNAMLILSFLFAVLSITIFTINALGLFPEKDFYHMIFNSFIILAYGVICLMIYSPYYSARIILKALLKTKDK